MGIFKLRKNKKFNYTPRYYDDKGEGSPYEIKHKFDEFRKTVGSNKGIKSKFNDAIEDYKNPDNAANKRILIIIAILVLVFLIIIDFDLSIFFSK
ncbi:MAG: riboflavin synthase subunit beta [Flaviramulus sp.]|nr:riboflavin synthase subunit beta [Flaviramulus sp.]NNC51181.1 riboflavin synthase subunit beta [Flaviramulus sp.]